MERGAMNNLGILAEEDDEEDIIGRTDDDESDDLTDSDGDDEADEGVRRGEPNKFDGLCDGVMNAMALVHAALQDLLEMKDEMLRHSLPPTLLVQLAMVSGRVFRSVSDLGNPVGELVRLVRVYSTPWEEKSAALKKLHEDYESKQRQLNIAVRRLQLVDAHSKRVAREKRIMNWEKLFSKMTSAKGHGRRWKFLIETIKQKAKLGLEHVQAYTQSLDDSSESETEETVTEPAATVAAGDVDDGSETQEGSPGVEGTEGSREENEEDEDDEEDGGRGDEREDEVGSRASGESGPSEGAETDDIPTVAVHIGPGDDVDIEGSSLRSASPKKVRFEESAATSSYIRPPMRDCTTWTGQPDHDRFLFIRIFCPEGLEQLGTGIKCSLSYDGNMFKTPMLDTPDDEESEMTEEVEERPSQRPQAARKAEGRSNADVTQETDSAKSKSKKYFEFEIPLPDEILEGILLLGEKPAAEPENIRIAIHHGQFEEIIAMATIDFQDIKGLNLETIWLPAPAGDDDVAVVKSRSNSLSCASSLGGESLSDSMDIPIMMDDDQSGRGLVSSTPRDDMFKAKDPLPFPLYPLHGGKTDSLHVPCGNVPLFLYWAKRPRPLHFNRQCGTLGIYDIVYDITGFDMTTTSKEDLHKEMVDRALSVAAFTPDPEKHQQEKEEEEREEEEEEEQQQEQSTVGVEDKSTSIEETVLKSEYDTMVERHQEEMIYLQEEYEKRLQELMQNLQTMQAENAEQVPQLISQQSAFTRPLSQASRASTTPGAMTPITSKRSERSDPSFFESTALPQTGQSMRTFSRDKTSIGEMEREKSMVSQSTASTRLKPLPPRNVRQTRNFRIGKPNPKWGETLPQDFFDRLRLWEEERRQHKQELNEKTLKDIKDNLEKKLAGQHKLSKREEQIYDALKDVSLPALFMPYKTGNIFNPRAHHYFHPTGSSDVRLTQPPSVFSLPPLPNSKLSVVNLFELSKNFRNRGPAWLVERYIQQQQPSDEDYPQTPAPTSAVPQVTTTSGHTPINENATPTSPTSIQPEMES